ncbi:MAG: CocE/NonD family hydrolase [Lachnospiraceae bacterium]|nr:CocE/NonD family hydrolase [Lachnospiraceae bacterium]
MAETGDHRFITSRGYVHVVSNLRGLGRNDDGPPSEYDGYDLIEWMARQPWCDGNIGMSGLSAYAQFQWNVATTQPPHLKAIAPLDAGNLYEFADYHTGGMLCLMRTVVRNLAIAHHVHGKPGQLSEEMEYWWEKAMKNND